MKRLFLGAALSILAAFALIGCGAEPEAPPQPTIITKQVGGEPVRFVMLDGADGHKLFLPIDEGVQCTADGCVPCDATKGGCVLDAGCPCRYKSCSPLCQPNVQLPVEGELAAKLAGPPRSRLDVRAAAEEATTTLLKKIEELEKRVRELEKSP